MYCISIKSYVIKPYHFNPIISFNLNNVVCVGCLSLIYLSTHVTFMIFIIVLKKNLFFQMVPLFLFFLNSNFLSSPLSSLSHHKIVQPVLSCHYLSLNLYNIIYSSPLFLFPQRDFSTFKNEGKEK